MTKEGKRVVGAAVCVSVVFVSECGCVWVVVLPQSMRDDLKENLNPG